MPIKANNLSGKLVAYIYDFPCTVLPVSFPDLGDELLIVLQTPIHRELMAQCLQDQNSMVYLDGTHNTSKYAYELVCELLWVIFGFHPYSSHCRLFHFTADLDGNGTVDRPRRASCTRNRIDCQPTHGPGLCFGHMVGESQHSPPSLHLDRHARGSLRWGSIGYLHVASYRPGQEHKEKLCSWLVLVSISRVPCLDEPSTKAH